MKDLRDELAALAMWKLVKTSSKSRLIWTNPQQEKIQHESHSVYQKGLKKQIYNRFPIVDNGIIHEIQPILE